LSSQRKSTKIGTSSFLVFEKSQESVILPQREPSYYRLKILRIPIDLKVKKLCIELQSAEKVMQHGVAFVFEKSRSPYKANF
jgi:hypothetical protein